MSLDDEARNKAAVTRFYDASNTGAAELLSETIDELIAVDARIRTPVPLETTGAQAVKEVFAGLHQAYPDLHVAVEDLIAEGDKVVSRNRVTGTHRGELMGVPPTGRSVTYDEIFIFRFVEGWITETWGVVDILSEMKQLGVI